MSSKDKKKVSGKPAAKPASKAPAKPTPKAPAKPAPKAAPAKPAAKPAAKPVAKPVAKAPAKVVAKPVVKAPAKPVAKAAVKPAAKPAAKPVAKAAPAKVAPAKPAPKAAPAKPVAKPVAKAAPVKPAPKAAPVKSAAKPAGKSAAKPAPAPKSVAKEKPVMVKPLPKVVEKAEKHEKVEIKEVKVAETSILLKTYKLVRTPFFFEVIEAEDRNNKKKYSSDAKVPEKPTICVRNRSSLVEETPEELIERLAQELEEENFGMMREFGSQLCTKCGVAHVSMEFRVDKDLGYCEECAEILRLGQSKEARKSDYQMSLQRRDPLATDEEGETEEGGTVDDEELEELEEE